MEESQLLKLLQDQLVADYVSPLGSQNFKLVLISADFNSLSEHTVPKYQTFCKSAFGIGRGVQTMLDKSLEEEGLEKNTWTQFVISMVIVLKRDGGYKSIISLKPLNACISCLH